MHRLANSCWIVLLCVAALAVPAGRLAAADPGADAPASTRSRAAKLPRPLTRYQGREIAQTMHYTGAPWLVRESRQREEDCQLLLDALHLQPGQTVCDMGCGNGFYTLQLAQRVGPTGRVFAVDVQPEMLHMLAERARDAGLKNIKPVLGTLADPKLPIGQLDLILLVDVYHEFSHPEEMLAAMRRALKPHGRLALAEFRLEDPEVPIKLLHKMSKKQILKEYAPNGLKLVEQFDKLPWQHLMFFEPAKPEIGAAASPDSQPPARPR
ncbi:MAG TPA: methyltransferase domain-containing protein [Pirellulales bacterium]